MQVHVARQIALLLTEIMLCSEPESLSAPGDFVHTGVKCRCDDAWQLNLAMINFIVRIN